MSSQWSEDIYVDVDIINKVAIWITSVQNQTSGAYYEIGSIYDRHMWVSGTMASIYDRY